MPLIMQQYLTSEQVADKLNVPHRTIMRWLREGYMPGHKLGKEWRINPEELEKFIEMRRNIPRNEES
jgi:excisionase family DNA binding protein